MKASVLCRLPNQRESLKHAFGWSKAGGRPHSQSDVSKIISFLKIFITRSGWNFAHERNVGASQMTISKRCDVPSCFLFVVVAGVCVCVREPVVCFCFEDGITNVYASTV